MATSIFNPTTSSLFQTTLPTAQRVELDGTKTVTIDMQETEQWVGLYDANGNKLMTKVSAMAWLMIRASPMCHGRARPLWPMRVCR